MFSIEVDNNLIKKLSLIDINKVLPHEEVLLERKEALKNYIRLLRPNVVISSIIICHETNMIIDGHHRYTALKELGFPQIPVTMIDYSSNKVSSYYDNRIKKSDILKACKQQKLLPSKSSKHIVFDESQDKWYPLILLSSLFCLDNSK